MKKKISLFILCGIILLGVCGCGNSETTITGTYKQTNASSDTFYLKLYKNGTCYWQQYQENVLPGMGHNFEYDTTECSYDYNDNELVITTQEEYTTTCSIENNVIDCGSDGIYEK